MEKIYKLLWYAGVEAEDFESCQHEVEKENRSKLHIYLMIAIGFLFLCICLSGGISYLRANTMYYVAGFVVMAGLAAVDRMFPEKNGLFLLWLMYALAGLLYAIGILIALQVPDSPSVSFIAFSLTIPLLFTVRPVQHIGNVVFFDVLFIVLVLRFESGQAQVIDIVDTVIFGMISCILSTLSMTASYQKFVANHKLKQIANYDLLTGVKNRNAFEEERATLKDSVTLSLGCIYVDANDLHTLNNTQGHESGDQMLQAVALAMQEQFGRKHCYRIGGDEFVAVLRNRQDSSVENSAQMLEKNLARRGYSVAVGIANARVEELDIDELFKLAEKRMYAAKNEYYRSAERPER